MTFQENQVSPLSTFPSATQVGRVTPCAPHRSSRFFLYCLTLLFAFLTTVIPSIASTVSTNPVIVILGATGAEEYEKDFVQSAGAFQRLTNLNTTVLTGAKTGETNFLEILRVELRKALLTEGPELWLVFIGHGTFDGREPKFNLPGTDLTATELAALLDEARRPVVAILCFSSSGQFLPKLSGKNRIVITATKSGFEQNYSRFGRYFAEAWHHSESDLNGDEQISLLEAFIYAASSTKGFYEESGRIMTEHALIDDNGDQRGTPASYFIGSKPAKKAGDNPVDGFFSEQLSLQPTSDEVTLDAAQRTERQKLEEKLQQLRLRKDVLLAEDYYRELEEIVVELGKLYRPGNKSFETTF